MQKQDLVKKYLDWINFQFENKLEINNAAIVGK
jgi:hypothetical protein